MKVKGSLDALPPSLKKWNKLVFGNIDRKIEKAKEQSENLYKLTPDKDILEEIKKEESDLNDWLNEKEILWAKKSRVNWLSWAGRNSKFFYLSTIIRRAINKISAIKNDQGE